jgi:hypothetical protein
MNRDVAERLRLPEYPLRLEIAIVDTVDEPCAIEREVGLILVLMSRENTARMEEWIGIQL